MEAKRTEMETDSLQAIHGIGPGVARRLADAGIGGPAALAAASPEEVARALKGMPVVSAERVRQWIAAAGQLAEKQPDALSDNGQHYATFRLELLLGQGNMVRRTRVQHVQSEANASWSGWATNRLIHFVVENAGFEPPPEMGNAFASSETEQMALRLHDLKVVDAQTRRPRHIVRRGQPYDVQFGVALEGGNDATPEPARMRATLYARSPDGEERALLGHGATARPLAPDLSVAFAMTPAVDLDPGPYRLELELDVETADRRRRWPTASLREGMLIVF